MLRQITRSFATRHTVRMPKYLTGHVFPACITDIHYKAGQLIHKDAHIVEACGMGIHFGIPSPVTGFLKKVHVKIGDENICDGDKLFTVETVY